MALSKEAKRAYQKEYMRNLREGAGLTKKPAVASVRPDVVRPCKPDYSKLPPLPVDTLLECNKGIGWMDVMELSRETVDLVYHEAVVMDSSILLRLVRAAGYRKRFNEGSRVPEEAWRTGL